MLYYGVNMKKRNIRIIIISIILICLSGIIIPLFMDKFIFGNNYPSSLSNSDWSSFLGAIWGGIIGGIGTLIAVCITTLDTKSVQEESRQQNLANYSKDKLKSIITAISSYWQKITAIEKYISDMFISKDLLFEANREINNIDESILNNPNMGEESRKILNEKKEKYTEIKTKEELKIADSKDKIKSALENIAYEVMLIKILISDVDFSGELISLIDNFQSALNDTLKIDELNASKINSDIHDFNTKAKEFIEKYENTFIKPKEQ